MVPLHVLECPSCGANLNYDDSSQVTVTCQYCGKVVEVPPELRTPPPTAIPTTATSHTDPAAISAAMYARLRVGNRVGAVKYYMEQTNASLEDAQTAVDAMMRRGLDSTGALPKPDISPLDLSDSTAVTAKIRELVHAGFKQMAVDIYIRVYQVNAKEALKAVETIERGGTPLVRRIQR